MLSPRGLIVGHYSEAAAAAMLPQRSVGSRGDSGTRPPHRRQRDYFDGRARACIARLTPQEAEPPAPPIQKSKKFSIGTFRRPLSRAPACAEWVSHITRLLVRAPPLRQPRASHFHPHSAATSCYHYPLMDRRTPDRVRVTRGGRPRPDERGVYRYPHVLALLTWMIIAHRSSHARRWCRDGRAGEVARSSAI